MNIQQAIKAKCKEKNIPMKTIAEGLGISMVALWRSLSKKQDIGIDRLKIICAILNCEMTLMIGTDKEVLVLIDK